MRKVTVHNGQCLQDTTVREMGSLEGIFEQALLNGFAITENLADIDELWTPNRSINDRIVTYYKKQGIRIATNIDDTFARQQLFEDGLFQPGLFE